ncbi:acyl-CoA desaturase [Bacteroidia bacterium]|nr:acyl-CoA desaturase [Bacteroidia bacterium]MDC1395192.1 acyl-CoA desaturase [Bacteroidia bacterium]
MKKEIVRFNNSNNAEFIQALRQNVNNYFKDNNISKYGNLNMHLKTAFMILLYFSPLVLMLSGAIESIGMMYFMWFLMSLGMAGIGLSVMHDANHGSYSNNRKVNAFFGFIVNFLGAYHTNWIIQHNVLHHSFTNIEGHDEDITKPVMRFSPEQPHKKVFKYQAFYAPIFYGLLTIYWLLAKDIDQTIRYGKRGLLKGQKKTTKSALAEVIFHKTWYVCLTLVLPLIILDIPWGHVVIGFLAMQFISGLILALIFQSAHVLEETHFYTPGENGSMENNWAIHQLQTTANFATGSKVFTWLVGGLNHQIEHHLFPHVCHVHYGSISKIIQKTAKDYSVPYHHHRTFYQALKSHFTLLNDLGRNKDMVTA